MLAALPEPAAPELTGLVPDTAPQPLSPAPAPVELPDLRTMLSGLAEVFAAPAAAAPVVNQSKVSNVQAPVSISVQAAAADPEAVGRSIYNTAERYLLRTLEG